jgi:hypothetical protein
MFGRLLTTSDALREIFGMGVRTEPGQAVVGETSQQAGEVQPRQGVAVGVDVLTQELDLFGAVPDEVPNFVEDRQQGPLRPPVKGTTQ